MGKFSRSKGVRGERKVIDKLEKIGIRAMRTANSGAAHTISKDKALSATYRGDLFCKLGEWVFSSEVKARADDSGWKCVKEWLGNADMLFICEDRKEALVVMPFHILSVLSDMILRVESSLEAIAPEKDGGK